jgi:predicted phosphodiesterase
MRCAIVSDIHGNLDALEAVLADAGDIDQLWCLGDVAGPYFTGFQPIECLTLLRRHDALCVLGNHDLAIIGKPGPAYSRNPDLLAMRRWTQEQLTDDHHTFLQRVPEQRVVGEFTLMHYPVLGPELQVREVPLIASDFQRFQTRYCLVGHLHTPLVYQELESYEGAVTYRTFAPETHTPISLDSRRLIVNVVSVGALATDTKQAAYMLYESNSALGTATLTLRLVPYAWANVLPKMHAAGVPPDIMAWHERHIGPPSALLSQWQLPPLFEFSSSIPDG